MTSTALAQCFSPAKMERAERFLGLSGAAEIGPQMADAMLGQLLSALQSGNPDISDRVIAVSKEEANKLFAKELGPGGGLLAQLATIYCKRFSDEEIDAFIAFYDSPAGRKFRASQSSIFQESVKIGNAWGMSIAPELVRSIDRVLTREGIKIPQTR